MYRLLTCIITLLILLNISSYGYCEEVNLKNIPSQQAQDSQIEAPMPDINTGLPTVTSEQFIAKITRIVKNIYEDAVEISPQLTLLACIVGGILGIILKEARKSVLWAFGGMLLILWAPQLIALTTHYASK